MAAKLAITDNLELLSPEFKGHYPSF